MDNPKQRPRLSKEEMQRLHDEYSKNAAPLLDIDVTNGVVTSTIHKETLDKAVQLLRSKGVNR